MAPEFAVPALLVTDERQRVGYRLHDMALVTTAREAKLVGHLDPYVLGPDWDLVEALRRAAPAGEAAPRPPGRRPTPPQGIMAGCPKETPSGWRRSG